MVGIIVSCVMAAEEAKTWNLLKKEMCAFPLYVLLSLFGVKGYAESQKERAAALIFAVKPATP